MDTSDQEILNVAIPVITSNLESDPVDAFFLIILKGVHDLPVLDQVSAEGTAKALFFLLEKSAPMGNL